MVFLKKDRTSLTIENFKKLLPDSTIKAEDKKVVENIIKQVENG